MWTVKWTQIFNGERLTYTRKYKAERTAREMFEALLTWSPRVLPHAELWVDDECGAVRTHCYDR